MNSGAVRVAIAASIGNFLQGWDNGAISGIFRFTALSFVIPLRV